MYCPVLGAGADLALSLLHSGMTTKSCLGEIPPVALYKEGPPEHGDNQS